MPIQLQRQEQPLKYKYSDDVAFLIKPHATAHDIFMLRNCGTLKADGTLTLKHSDFSEMLLQSFIVGWEGVQLDGKAVPYSWDILVSSFPRDNARDVFIELVSFIFENTDVKVKDEAAKKD